MPNVPTMKWKAKSDFDTFYSLAPVLRGEGWGEGFKIRDRRFALDSTLPLSLALSPEYRGEGECSRLPRKRIKP
jgi:hypothetical protein